MTERFGELVALTAGGTGGHMFPAQALARELLARGSRVALITDRRGGGFGPDLPQVDTTCISAGALAGGGLLRKFRGLAQLGLGYFQARGALARLEADTVVGFGGYASVPATLAAAHRGLRVVLHEQNAVLGRANRLLAPRASAVATSFTSVEGLLPADRHKAVFTGNPVRPAIAALGQHPYALPGQSERIRLLVIGGSQGAQIFNTVVPAAIEALPEAMRRRLTVSQQVRGPGTDEVRAVYEAAGVEADLAGFFEDMPERLRSVHLVICRSGASTVAELAAAGRPAILVPYPHATDDHQRANAEALAAAGGAWVIPQAELTAGELMERLRDLFGDVSTLAQAAAAARAVDRNGAAGRLADVVLGLASGDNGADSNEAATKEAAA